MVVKTVVLRVDWTVEMKVVLMALLLDKKLVERSDQVFGR
jgi:hypothetical protein